MALDLMLKSLLNSAQFNELPEKDWQRISQLVPGTTPKQVEKRYNELLQQSLAEASSGLASLSTTGLTSGGGVRLPGRVDSTHSEHRGSRPNSGKPRGVKSDKESDYKNVDGKRPNSADQSPVMVIHVCDEAKNLKQDFHCNRDLLVSQMRYFAEYLSTDAQRWEDVDISVHCDVQIFEWLMKYVKRNTKDVTDPPRLEPNNVISILISSDFLKMDTLVQKCIEYCHTNMNAIIATPCNMNCINDKLVARIADLFSHSEADDIRDRKDKFKSKLFAKKLEKLFDADFSNKDSPENASLLYRCNFCKRLMTKNMESKLKCLQSRMTINNQGKLAFSHARDPTWDVNDYLLDLKAQLKHWREVYWRVWGTINHLTCSRCIEVFPCSELGHCRFHPEPAQFESLLTGASSGVVGVYGCCGQKTLRFDPTQPNTGCKVRDHIVNLDCLDVDDSDSPQHVLVYNDLLAHRDAICVEYEKLPAQIEEEEVLNIFSKDEQTSVVKILSAKGSKSDSSLSDEGNKNEGRPQPRLQALTVEREVSYDDEVGMGESEDEVGDEEDGKIVFPFEARRPRFPRRSRVTVDPQAILLDAPDFSTTKQRKWDSSRSMRWNQDAQREEDQRRMNEIIQYLTRLRLNNEKLDKLKQREYAGGVFQKLEAQWKAINMPLPKASNALTRTKTRLTQSKLT